MQRIKLLLQKLYESGIEALLVTSVENVTYLSGFRGDSSHLIVSANGCFLITDGRYTEQASQECHPEIQIRNWIDNKRYGVETYQSIIDKSSVKRLGFETHILTHDDYERLSNGLKGVQFNPVESMIEKLRQVKDATEIENLEEACRISDNALELTISCIKPGISEIEITAELEYNLKTNGAEDISFQTIALSGVKTSLLHGRPGNKKIEAGDFLLFDFGALYGGYHADISRTFVVGKASAEQKEIYQVIRNAQHEAVQSLGHGVEGVFPDNVVRRNIPEKYIRYYYPGLGHGVGLQIHETPFIKADADFKFQKGMVVTIEPGLYIPGWGGLRIEDSVLISENGPRSLTHFNRDLVEL